MWDLIVSYLTILLYKNDSVLCKGMIGESVQTITTSGCSCVAPLYRRANHSIGRKIAEFDSSELFPVYMFKYLPFHCCLSIYCTNDLYCLFVCSPILEEIKYLILLIAYIKFT